MADELLRSVPTEVRDTKWCALLATLERRDPGFLDEFKALVGGDDLPDNVVRLRGVRALPRALWWTTEARDWLAKMEPLIRLCAPPRRKKKGKRKART